MSLKDYAKSLKVTLPFMDGREKGDMKRLNNMPCTIREYGFLTDEQDKEYVCFTIDEDPQHFYFGGQVLTENMRDITDNGFQADVFNEGLPVLFGTRTSKKNREYTTVTFYPEETK